MKRMINAFTNPDTEYEVTVGFCGFVGREAYLTIDARVDADHEEILYIIQEDYADELLEGEVIDFDDAEYEVEVTFDGQRGTSEIYQVLADDEEEAIAEAIEEARYDLDVIEFHEL